MKNTLVHEANRDVTSGFTKHMLKRKYRLLYNIILRVIMGITFSRDQITQEKMHVMATIIDKLPNLNQAGLVKYKLLDQQTKFKVNSTRKVEVTKKICIIHNAKMTLMDKLPGHSWGQAGIKEYVSKFKVILWEDAPLIGFSVYDPTPTREKESIASSVLEEQLASHAAPKPKRKTLKRKQIASKPAKKAEERDVAVEVPTDKRQKKITSLLQPANESFHFRDEDSDDEIRTTEVLQCNQRRQGPVC